MRKEIVYEWCIETKDEHGDIVDNNFQDVLNDLSKLESNQDLVLIRHEGNEREGITDTVWAYVVNGKLPDNFSDGMGSSLIGIIVPKCFKLELSKWILIPTKAEGL